MIIFVYAIIPLVLLLLFCRFIPHASWLLIPLCPVLDILFFRAEFAYYEARGLFALFSGVQAIILTIVILPVFFYRVRPRFKSQLYLSLSALTVVLMVLLVGVNYQHHVYFSYFNSAPAHVNLIYGIPFLPFLFVFLILFLHSKKKENNC